LQIHHDWNRLPTVTQYLLNIKLLRFFATNSQPVPVEPQSQNYAINARKLLDSFFPPGLDVMPFPTTPSTDGKCAGQN